MNWPDGFQKEKLWLVGSGGRLLVVVGVRLSLFFERFGTGLEKQRHY
jgi:hypothetical protein